MTGLTEDGTVVGADVLKLNEPLTGAVGRVIFLGALEVPGMLVGTEVGRLRDPLPAGAVVAGATVEAGAVVEGMWQRY